ncbi:MAG: DUF4177 domain-containing protein [Rhodobacter sp.]|nr:DUF4177 domain-containing protein [Rhodobacter sp.]
MQRYEYHVVPAPRRGEKARDAKTTADRFAVALTRLMNDLGRDGWEYLRADTLPCEERAGLTGRTTAFQHMLVFRRTAAPAQAAPAQAAPAQAGASPHLAEPLAIAAPLVAAPAPEGSAPPIAAPADDAPSSAPPLGPAQRADGALG